MFEHPLPEYVPEVVGIGQLYKVALQTIPREPTELFVKERAGGDVAAEAADRWFLASLIGLYGRRPFKRGNLDAGRLNRLFGREVVPAEEQFDPVSLDTELRVDVERASVFFTQMN